jgi:hypothetical protein
LSIILTWNKFLKHKKGRRARLLIASAWGLSCTFAIPTLFLFFEKELINEKTGGR